MIPKKIHYCWFGGNDIPEKDKNNIESWKKFCPDYEIKKWDETNYDVNKITYIKEAYQCKKYAFVSDYARLDILYNEGGIYLDTDVEIIKNIDDLLDNTAFCGFEKGGRGIGLGLMCGSEKGAAIIKDLMDHYNDKIFLQENGDMILDVIDKYTDGVLVPKGLKHNDKMQIIEGLRIYPSEYFGTMDYYAGMENGRTVNTRSLHHYNASWISDERRVYLERQRALAKKYGYQKLKNGKAARIETFKEDLQSVKQEKGGFYAVLYRLKHFWKVYF